MPWRAASGHTAPWHTASECTVPRRAASEFTLPVRFALGAVCALPGCVQSVPSAWCIRTQIFFPDVCLTHGDTTRPALSLAIDANTTPDHSSLTLTLSLPYTTPPPKPYRCWTKANWNSFGSHIQVKRMDLSDLQGPEATLRTISNITLLIHQATEATIPYKSPRKAEAPWWNHSLTLAKEATKRADRRARLTTTDTNRQDSQYKCRKWTTIVHNAKTTYHVHRLQNATTRTIWKTIQCHSTHNKPIPPLEGQFNFGDKCKALRNSLFPPVNTDPQTPLPPDLLTHTRDIRQHTRPVTIHETRLAITHLKYHTSVGPDDISYTTLRYLNEAAPLLLPNLFTACLTWSVHPPEWKKANCVVVPKPGKKSYSVTPRYTSTEVEVEIAWSQV